MCIARYCVHFCFNPFVHIYTYEIPNPLRLLYVYTYTDFAFEIWGFYRHLTDTLRYHYTRCSRASGLQLAAILQHVYQRKKSGVYLELSAVFGRVLENYDCRTKFNSSLGMEYNGELYGFSAVKVKLVDS